MALTQISTKGIKDGTITGSDLATNIDLVDDQKLRFGTGNDLEIYGIASDGTAAIINHANGDLLIKHGADKQLISRDDGAIELYFDDTLRLETRANDVKFHGGLVGVDNVKLQLGSSGDLQLYHDGTNSYIDNANTGILRIRGGAGGSGRDIQIQAKNGEFSINAIPDGAVELYYDNTKKFETTSGGVLTTGNTSTTGAFVSTQTGGGVLSDNLSLVDDKKVKLGASDDLQIYHNGSHSVIQNDTGTLFTLADNLSFKNNANNETLITAAANGAVELYHDNSKKFETHSGGVSILGNLSLTNADSYELRLGASSDFKLLHNGTDSKITNTTGNLIITQSDGIIRLDPKTNENGILIRPGGATELYFNNSKKFETSSTGATITGTLAATNTNITTQMFMPDQGQIRLGNSDDLKLYHDGHSVIQNTHSSAAFLISSHATHIVNAALTENIAKFIENGSVELYHNNSKQFETTSTGTTTFGTHHSTSDIALKTNIKPITNTLEKIQQITGYKYKFIKSNENSIGVVAQEVEKVFPELVDGTEGNKTLQYNGLIGVLIEAVKELSAEVAALKAS